MNKRSKYFILFIIIVILFSSCTSILKGLSDSLYRQEDIKLVEDGAPAFLLLFEGLIGSDSKNKKQLATGIQLFSAYSNAFVKDEKRKKIFSAKTKKWALNLLDTYPSFRKSKGLEYDEYKEWVNVIKKKDIPYVFWAANAWIMWILSNTDSVSAFLDLPKARVIIDKIYELDDTYYFGAPHLFYGIFYSLLPRDMGGDLDVAEKEFNQALALSKDEFLMTKVSYAQFFCKAKYDRDTYEKVLTEVMNADIDKYPQMRLLNIFAKEQAVILLDEIDEYFFEDDFY